MRISFSTLTILEQAGDEAASVIARAAREINGILWETDFLQIHFHRLPVSEKHWTHYYKMRAGVRSVMSPDEWGYRWEKKAQAIRSPQPLTMQQAMRQCMPLDPNTLDVDLTELYQALGHEEEIF